MQDFYTRRSLEMGCSRAVCIHKPTRKG